MKKRCLQEDSSEGKDMSCKVWYIKKEKLNKVCGE